VPPQTTSSEPEKTRDKEDSETLAQLVFSVVGNTTIARGLLRKGTYDIETNSDKDSFGTSIASSED
jgi:hypothetical protein